MMRELLLRFTRARTLAGSARLTSENRAFSEEKFGGGGQSRTVDAADMSRVL